MENMVLLPKSQNTEYPEPKYPIPRVTFGFELELVFAARR
jgi:hypothetical protein